jgi:hypothetical protein
MTLRGVQSRRPSLHDLVEEMKKITAPTLIMTGDEDWACLEPAVLMKEDDPGRGAGGFVDRATRPIRRAR